MTEKLLKHSGWIPINRVGIVSTLGLSLNNKILWFTIRGIKKNKHPTQLSAGC